jgi:hypothetical protein
VQCLITAHEAGVLSETEQQEEPIEQESMRSVMGVINDLVAHPDGSRRYVHIAQEPVTPWPRRPRPGKENDGKAASSSQIAPRTGLGLTIQTTMHQADAAPPFDASTPQLGEQHHTPTIYLDEVSAIRHTQSQSTQSEEQCDRDEDVLTIQE